MLANCKCNLNQNTPGIKKYCSGQELKKGQDENDVKPNWAVKASCC